MAFGWKTEYEKRVPAEGRTNWEIFAIAEKACEELEWEYLVADEKTFTATTPIHWTLNEEIITIVTEGNEIIFKSQSESLELYEAGRNRKNIEELLLPAFNRQKLSIPVDQIISNSERIRQEAQSVKETGNRVSSDKITFGTKDHEMTFFLMFLNVAVFIFLAIKGVDILKPAPEDITRWGGNVREFVVAGDWWRLVTNLFVHAGIYSLLINLFGLYFIGLLVETILGKVKFLIAYITVGALGSLLSIYLGGTGVTAGASGAVSGLYGVLVAFASTGYANRKFNIWWFLSILIYAGIIIWFGVQGLADDVTNIGGFVSGVCIGLLFYFFHFRRNLARAGGTRISIEILLIAAILVFLFIRTGKDDSLRFERAVMKLNQIELKAMTQMQDLQSAESDKQAAEILKQKALPLWRNFQKEINKTDRYKLQDEFKRKRDLLHNYSELRIKQTELIYKSISEETNKYDPEIDTPEDLERAAKLM